MRLEFDPNTTELPFNAIEAFENAAEGSSRAQEFLRAGIKAAQTGNRAQARQYLLRVIETEPDNENAWLWLASISEYPEELLIFLNNVLEVNPTNERALEWLKATNSLLAVTFVQRGIDAAKTTRNDFAKQCFYQALAYDAKNESAWLWLAFVSGSVEEKRTHLDKVLRINPANEAARNALKDVQTEMAQALLRTAAASADDRPAANEILAEVLQKCPEMTEAWFLKSNLTDDDDEKIECFEKILEINPAHEAARTSLNSLLAAMKKAESPTEHENLQMEEAASFTDEAEESVEENRFEENFQFGQTENNNSAQEFKFTQISDENDYSTAELNENAYLSAKQETAPHQNTEDKKVSFDEKMFFGGETQSVEESFSPVAENPQPEAASETNAESVESLIEETKSDFVSSTAPEEVLTSSYNCEVEKNAVENEYQTEESDAAENDFNEQLFQDANYHSTEFESEENQLIRNFSSEFNETAEAEKEEETEQYTFAPNAAPTANETSQPDQDNSSDNLNQEDNMLEVENYHSDNNDSAEFDSIEKFVYEQSNFMEVEKAEEFSAEPERQTLPKWQPEAVACPFCNAENNAQAFDCGTCRTVLSLSDLEMLLANQNFDAEMLGQAVERMERVKGLSGFGESELLYLGIGHINLKNFRQGFSYLQKASQANPNDVLLSSQVNALAIRLEEIERQEEVHNQMMKGKKILVVDDSPTVRKLISGKLEKSGHEVVCAVDGMDALAKLDEIAPDLILLDITMPRMDGYQVCKLIRSNPVTRDIPVVMISGKDGFFDKVRGRMAGTTGYITKPFGPETLMKALDIYIQPDDENVFSGEDVEVLMEA